MFRRVPITTAVLGAIVLAGCSEPVSVSRAPLRADAMKSLETSAVRQNTPVQWNAIARAQTLTHTMSQQLGVRMFAYLSLAQANAANAADDGRSVSAAIAGASAAVLASFFPDQVAYFDAQVGPAAADDEAFTAGVALGRSVGADVLARAATDGFTSSTAGVVIPVCPGCWVSAPGVAPVFPRLAEMRPFFLSSASQFRPGPPPAFGSAEYLAALAEVRHFSDTRTYAQDSLAKFWAKPGGFPVVQSYANQVASAEIAKFGLNERKAARVLAFMNMVAMDAFIGSHDAKYTYWMIRPSQADPGIVLAIGLPNHPSYPSNHAAVTGASMAVLAHFFRRDADYLNGLADQAGISRIYAGIHYRFDMDAGFSLGRTIARYALSHDVNVHDVANPNPGGTVGPSSGSTAVYAAGATGNATPLATIQGSNTGLITPADIALDAEGRLYVANPGGGCASCSASNAVTVYTPGATGNVAPTGSIAGSNTRPEHANLDHVLGCPAESPFARVRSRSDAM
jgi:PAP2 superfamily protein